MLRAGLCLSAGCPCPGGVNDKDPCNCSASALTDGRFWRTEGSPVSVGGTVGAGDGDVTPTALCPGRLELDLGGVGPA